MKKKHASKKAAQRRLAPMHPGEVLREDFLIPLDMSAGALAKVCGVPRTRIERLANEETVVTADTALRLSRYFGTSERFWLHLQAQFDLESERDRLGDRLDREVVVLARMA